MMSCDGLPNERRRLRITETFFNKNLLSRNRTERNTASTDSMHEFTTTFASSCKTRFGGSKGSFSTQFMFVMALCCT